MYDALRLYFRREALRPPPVADKGSKALSEITSKRKHIYVQRIATIFQTGGHYPPLQVGVNNMFLILQPTSTNENNIRNGQEKSKRRNVRFKNEICETQTNNL